MELFYSAHLEEGLCCLGEDESLHCVRDLRHKPSDEIDIIDGKGNLYHCRLVEASPKRAVATILHKTPSWGSHPYRLRMAVCPTKDIDRFEWFVEKATEIGVDVISPVIGEHSERKVLKTERIRKLALSATKQSLKGAIPVIEEAASVKELIKGADPGSLRLIACCFEDERHPRMSIAEAIRGWEGPADYTVLIGPEGDFSPGELKAALEAGFIPVHLGQSRLRTETAALLAVQSVYLLKTL